MLGRKINPVGLKGREIHNRIVDLMGINENVESVSAHDVKLTKKGPDGKVYAIVKENHKYFIKVAEGETITSNDLEYMGGLKNKIKESYPSYEKATKRLLHKFNEIARTQGLYYEGNILRNDNLLSENVAFAGGAGYGFAKEGEENEIPKNPEDYKNQPGYVGVTEEMGEEMEDINGDKAPEDKETSGDNLDGDFEEKPKASSTNTGKPRSKGHDTEVMKESKGKLSNVIENIDAIVDSILEGTKKKSLN